MPFDYYERLPRTQKAIYRRSDAIDRVPLPDARTLSPIAIAIGDALTGDDRLEVERQSARLVGGICRQLGIGGPSVRVLAHRPRAYGGELYGLYTWEEGKRPILMVWMRTAAHGRPVAHRTFVRTLMHEVAHHLDYHFFQLAESFHTKGFFQRESSLTRQLLPKREKKAKRAEQPKEELADSVAEARALIARLKSTQLGLNLEE